VRLLCSARRERCVVGGDDLLAEFGWSCRLHMNPTGLGTSGRSRQFMKASSSFWSPWAIRCWPPPPAETVGCSATKRSPSNPPQSWHTSVRSRSPRRSKRAWPAIRRAGIGVVAPLGGLVGSAESDKVRGYDPVPAATKPGSSLGRGSTNSVRRCSSRTVSGCSGALRRGSEPKSSRLDVAGTKSNPGRSAKRSSGSNNLHQYGRVPRSRGS